jgi:hypothetical protein
MALVIRRWSGVPAPQGTSSPAGFLARLGWTRIGSPGIFGVQTHETPS